MKICLKQLLSLEEINQVLRNKTIINPVDTSLGSYEFGGETKEEPIVLANDSIADIVSKTKVPQEYITIIVGLIKKGDLKQFRSIDMAIDNDTTITVSKVILKTFTKKLKDMNGNNELKINSNS